MAHISIFDLFTEDPLPHNEHDWFPFDSANFRVGVYEPYKCLQCGTRVTTPEEYDFADRTGCTPIPLSEIFAKE